MGKSLLARVKTGLIDTIYPARCLACPTETETPSGLCGACWRDVHFFAGDVCDYCGVNVPTADEHSARQICADCDQRPPAWDRGRSAIAHQGAGHRVTSAFKYSDRTDMAAALAGWMVTAGTEILSPDCLVVPVPLHWSRLLRRRYNQAALLAQHVAEQTGCELLVDGLHRRWATPDLSGKPAQLRHELLADAIEAPTHQRAKFNGREIVLVDDLMMSGATLSACTEACREAGAVNVYVLTLSRVAREL